MKKTVLLLFLVLAVMGMSACGKMEKEPVENPGTNQETSVVSGSFTACVREIMPDYVVDDMSPNMAIVTDFQDYPYALYVGEEIGKQLETGKIYVFTIEPVTVNTSKEFLQGLTHRALISAIQTKITDFRLATEDEIGLESLRLTVE